MAGAAGRAAAAGIGGFGAAGFGAGGGAGLAACGGAAGAGAGAGAGAARRTAQERQPSHQVGGDRGDELGRALRVEELGVRDDHREA